MTYGMCTDPGRVRTNNEDACVALPERGLFVVADGVGGYEGGEVASRTAVEALAREYQKPDGNQREADAARLTSAAASADLAIREANKKNGRRMATTLTAAVVRGRDVTILHAGDSKALVVDGSGARQLTEDHTVVAQMMRERSLSHGEAASHPQRNVITKALGGDQPLHPDTFTTSLPEGSTLVLCSDGLTDFVTHEEIAQLVQRTPDPQDAAERLVNAANRNGGRDNITTILVKMPGSQSHVWKSALRSIVAFVFVALVIGGTTYAGRWFWSRQFYLGEKNGRLALYRGLPMKIAGMPLSRLDFETLIPFEAVHAPYNKRLREGMSVTGIEDARKQLLELVHRGDSHPVLAYASRGRLFIIPVQRDGTVSANTIPNEICTYDQTPNGICWSPDASLLAFGSRGKVYLVAAQKSATPIEIADGEWPIQFSTDFGLVFKELSGDGMSLADLLTGQKNRVNGLEGNLRLASPPLLKVSFQRTGEPVVSSDVPISVPLAPIVRPVIARYPARTRALLTMWVSAGIPTNDGQHVLILRTDPMSKSRGDLIAADRTGKRQSIVARDVEGVFALSQPEGEH